jgi:hypothetical protein
MLSRLAPRERWTTPMDAPFTVTFEAFWSWVRVHPECILRAGTPEAVLFDDDDVHWEFTAEEPGTLVVQVVRGKRLVGELLIDPEQVAYVEAVPPERDDEHVFELITEAENDRFAAWFFVLVHGWQAEDGVSEGRVH